jgi:peptide/nickel transport system substrate-binding protein
MKTTALISVGLLATMLTACSKGGAQTAGGNPDNLLSGGTFTTTVSSDPGNLDPLQSATNTAELVTSFAYDTLVGLTDKAEVVPRLASKWDFTATSVTYTLRDDITCGDGSELTASQVAANFEYIRNPDNQSSALGTNLPDTEFTVNADDAARTVTISRTTPYGFLLSGAGGVPIVCAKGTADRKLLATGTDGTGPFKLVEAVPGDHYTFEVRKDYRWGPNGASSDVPGFPAKVVVKVVANTDTAVNLLLSNQLSDVDTVGTERKRLEGKGYHEVTRPGALIEVFYNQRDGHPGADLEVRRALTTAINRDQARKVLTEGDEDAREATSLVTNEPKPCKDDTVSGNLPKHDAKAAKEILDRAGWTVGSGGIRAKDGKPLKITLLYVSAGPAIDAGMELIANWWKAIGVDVTLKGADGNAVNQELFGTPDSWDVSVLSISVNLPSELVGFLSGDSPPDGQNFPGIQNSEYERLVEQAGPIPVPSGCLVWAHAEKALLQHFDVVPVSAGVVHSYLNKARYSNGPAGPAPTSIRLLAG